MNVKDYFKHARSIGAFSAKDCLELARRAHALDVDSELKKLPRPIVVWYEVNPDGTRMKISNGVTVY